MNDLKEEIEKITTESKRVTYVFQYTLGYRESLATDNGCESHTSKDELITHVGKILSIWEYTVLGKCDLFFLVTNSNNERAMISVGLVDIEDCIVAAFWTRTGFSSIVLENPSELTDLLGDTFSEI